MKGYELGIPRWWRPRCSHRKSPWHHGCKDKKGKAMTDVQRCQRSSLLEGLPLLSTCSAPEELWMQSCSPPHEETDTEQQPNEGKDERQHLQYNNAKAISENTKLSKQKGFHAMALFFEQKFEQRSHHSLLNKSLTSNLRVAVHHWTALDHPL